MLIDKYLISKRVYDSWLAYCQVAISELLKKYPDLQTSEIPDENIRKTLFGYEIYVKIRNSELKMRIPKDEICKK